MQVSWRRCKLVMNASVFFFFLYSQTRMWFVYVCDTVWPVTAVSLPGFLLFFFVFFLLLFLSKIETMRHCRPPSHISVCSALDRARDSAALKLPLLSRLPAYFPSVRLDFSVSSDFMSRWRFQNNRILSTYLRAWNHRPNVSDFLSLWEKT